MTKPIPDGFHTLTPHIVVADGAAAIEFYKKAFAAQELARLLTPDGKTVMRTVFDRNAPVRFHQAMIPAAVKPTNHARPRACTAAESQC